MIKWGRSVVLSVLFFNPFFSSSQQTASLFENTTEEKEIQFQEYFFKSLVQKSIKNYQKAIENLEECHAILSGNKAVYFEFSKNYLFLGKTIEAKKYINAALALDPTNSWMLRHAVAIQKKDKNYEQAIEMQLTLVQQDPNQREELVFLYALNKQFDKALSLINVLEKNTQLTERLRQLKHNLASREQPPVRNIVKNLDLNGLIAHLESNKPSYSILKGILEKSVDSNLEVFFKYSLLAIDLYPDQPLFYLYRGKALQIQKKHQESIVTLETGLDFVIDNPVLRKEFFRVLIEAYTRINKPLKVLEFTKKLKKI